MLNLPPGMTLEQILCAGLGADNATLPSVSAFERLHESTDPVAVRRLVDWIAPQVTCDQIIEQAGFEGLQTVLAGIARAASTLKVPMNRRVSAVAEVHGWPVY